VNVGVDVGDGVQVKGTGVNVGIIVLVGGSVLVGGTGVLVEGIGV